MQMGVPSDLPYQNPEPSFDNNDIEIGIPLLGEKPNKVDDLSDFNSMPRIPVIKHCPFC